ncbi:MAG: hypothetical protein CSA53_02715 [Gammaproteobacteria bacterium]|nr:MAG: hypothetical protein CSA53_02715 [Gammaproteobacteria bacterium]
MKTITNLLLSVAILALVWIIWGDQVSRVTSEVRVPDLRHNARNSLDWEGDYKGTVSCAGCEPVALQVSLSGDGYELVERIVGQPGDPQFYTGDLQWEKDGGALMLAHYRFLVTEDALELLDIQGQPMDSSTTYQLTKIP